jgi:hypothetical protein
MSGTRSKRGEMRYVYKILVGNLKGRDLGLAHMKKYVPLDRI